MFLAVSISTMSQSCAAGGNDKDMKTLMRVLKSVGVKAYTSACEMCEASVAVERDARRRILLPCQIGLQSARWLLTHIF